MHIHSLTLSHALTSTHLFPNLFSFLKEERVLLGNAWNVWCKAAEDVMCAPAHRIGYLMASKQTHQNNLSRPPSQYALVVLDSDTRVSSVCAFHSHNPFSHCRLRVKCWGERSPVGSFNTVFLGFLDRKLARWDERKTAGRRYPFVWVCVWVHVQTF